MRAVAGWILVLGLGLGATMVRGAETGADIERRQLKKTVTEQSKQIEDLRAQIVTLKNPTASATTKPATTHPATTRPAVTPGTLEQRTMTMTKALDRGVQDFVFDRIALVDLPAKLKAQYGLDVEIDSKVLAEAGIKDTVSLSANIHLVKLGQALTTLLASSGSNKKLDYQVTEGFVRITTQEITKAPTVQIYDIRDFVAQVSKNAAAAGKPIPYHDIIHTFTLNLQAAVLPESWRDNGGTIGSIREFAGLLYIAHYKQGHEQIAQFIKKYREKNGKR